MQSRLLFIAAVLASALALPTKADTFVNCFGGNDCTVFLEGRIESHTLKDFLRIENQGKTIATLTIEGSDGGDVKAALAIGRLLRKHQTTVNIRKPCSSACVLLVAGAVWRMDIEDGYLGIHRPYALDAYSDYPDAKEHIDALNQEIEGFLREMNVSPSLLQAMNSVPSYSVRYLILSTFR